MLIRREHENVGVHVAAAEARPEQSVSVMVAGRRRRRLLVLLCSRVEQIRLIVRIVVVVVHVVVRVRLHGVRMVLLVRGRTVCMRLGFHVANVEIQLLIYVTEANGCDGEVRAEVTNYYLGYRFELGTEQRRSASSLGEATNPNGSYERLRTVTLERSAAFSTSTVAMMDSLVEEVTDRNHCCVPTRARAWSASHEWNKGSLTLIVCGVYWLLLSE